MPGIGGQPPDQLRQVAPHQRFAAGDAQLGDAQRDRDAHEALDLFETQNLAARHELHARLPACSRSSGYCSGR